MRMYLVLRRGSIASLERACILGGEAAVACVRRFADDPALAEWRPRPGKVCLRARNESQWRAVLEEPHALAGTAEGEGVAALPPRRRSERGPLLERLQAMSSELEPLPAEPRPGPAYLLNPGFAMSSGKVVAQVAHAAVLAADAGEWAAGAASVARPPADAWAEALARPDLLARVIDTGLTEVPPGTVTVIAFAA